MNKIKKNSQKKTRKYLFLGLTIGILIYVMSNNSFLLAAKKHQVKIRSDRTTLIDNKPFFPFGFYHVSWESTATMEMRLKDLNDIADAGFNTVYISAPRSNGYEKFFDEAEKLGIYLIGEQFSSTLDYVNAFKHKSAVLGWSIADDVDKGNYTPKQVMRIHQQVKAADPDRLTYISGFSDEIGRFANCADIVARQSYSHRLGTTEELPYAYRELSIARDGVSKFNKTGTVYANLQAFSWSAIEPKKNPNAREPNADEIRNMTYQALLGGAKGFIYYTYHDEVWHLPEHQDLWNGLKSLVPEINAIKPILLDGKLQEIDTGIENVLAGIWLDRDKALALVVNTSYENTNEVSLEMPKSFNKSNLLFDRDDGKMKIDGDRISGSISPLEVIVYKLEG